MITNTLISHFSTACEGGNFLKFPTWHEYLPATLDSSGACIPQITGLNDIWLIVAAVIEIMLRIATLIAVAVIMYAGFEYITSQGEPDKTTKARMALINATVGLLLAVFSAVIVAFLAKGF